ncbi:MAG: sulfatase-like hydrolase/transferase [Cyclobacteriaceae bacterium]
MRKTAIQLLYTLVFISSVISSCKKEDNTTVSDTPTNSSGSSSSSPNILLLIADDLGKDATPGFLTNEILTKANMPTLDSLRNNGLRFVNLWAAPTCAPTRATLLTGKYGIDNGVLEVQGASLSTSHTSIQAFLDQQTGNDYSSAIIGKWHVSSNYNDPQAMGVDYFAGISGGGVSEKNNGYYNWGLVTNGVAATVNETTYITTKLTDLAIDWMQAQSKPWFLWMAYNAPHTPFHEPPANLHTRTGITGDKQEMFLAAAEALDTEIGRLIAAIPSDELANTIIMYIGDNGTPTQVAQRYQRVFSKRVKGSLFQGGVNVPMVVSGYGVTRIGGTDSSLINTTDFYATIADIANTSTDSIHHSVSFKSLLSEEDTERRNYTYSEVSSGDKPGHIIRNSTYKLMKFDNDSTAFYNLLTDPFEESDLTNGAGLNASEIADSTALSSILETIRD